VSGRVRRESGREGVGVVLRRGVSEEEVIVGVLCSFEGDGGVL